MVLSDMFQHWIIPEEGQGLLATPEAWVDVLNMIPRSLTALQEKLDKAWSDKSMTPQKRWESFQSEVRDVAAQLRRKPEHAVSRACVCCVGEIGLKLLWTLFSLCRQHGINWRSWSLPLCSSTRTLDWILTCQRA